MIRYIKIILILITIPCNLFAKTQYFQDGLILYNDKKFKEAKFKFEQDLVLNPKNEMSYLFLSKIFKRLNKKDLQEQNLNTVILLNPENEEAIYNLARLKLETADYEKSQELNDRLITFCENYCNNSKKLRLEIENLSKK